MELKIKYWSNAFTGVEVATVFCDTCKELKKAIESLLEDRPDIDNVEVYSPGDPKPLSTMQNIRQRKMFKNLAAV